MIPGLEQGIRGGFSRVEIGSGFVRGILGRSGDSFPGFGLELAGIPSRRVQDQGLACVPVGAVKIPLLEIGPRPLVELIRRRSGIRKGWGGGLHSRNRAGLLPRPQKSPLDLLVEELVSHFRGVYRTPEGYALLGSGEVPGLEGSLRVLDRFPVEAGEGFVGGLRPANARQYSQFQGGEEQGQNQGWHQDRT